jgi:glycosyltransferase involved in cell wall biosynthesis
VEAGTHLYGGARQVVYLLRGLKQAGCRNVLVCPSGSAIARESAAFVEALHAIPMAGDLDVGLVLRLRRLIRGESPDLVHLHSRRGADLWGGIAAWWASVPCVLSRRVDNPESRLAVAMKYRLFDRVITISEGIRRVLLAEGVPAGKLVCVPSAVDTETFRPGCRWIDFRRHLGLPPDAKVIGMIAQLIPRKGHRYLLEALPQILNAVPETRVLLLGKGALEAELRRRCAAMGLSEAVRFLGFREDLHAVLPCIDLVVHPAEMEGLGVALLQAAACAIPIVASPVGGIPEIVREAESGYLVPVGATRTLADRIIALLEHPELARAMGRRGREIAEQHFSIAAMVQGNLDTYRSVLAERWPNTAVSPG